MSGSYVRLWSPGEDRGKRRGRTFPLRTIRLRGIQHGLDVLEPSVHRLLSAGRQDEPAAFPNLVDEALAVGLDDSRSAQPQQARRYVPHQAHPVAQ